MRTKGTPGGSPPWLPGVHLARAVRENGRVDPEPPFAQAGDLVCSARGCRRPARWALRWNNPKIHTPDRRKTWLACEEHQAHLGEFLSARAFLRETIDASAVAGDDQR
jgi:hypothetical protein